MRIIMIRSNPVRPDSRVEKEVYSLRKAGHEINVLCWDRDSNHKASVGSLQVMDQHAYIVRLGFKAGFGLGKKSLFPFIKFQFSMLMWLFRNRKTYDAIHACDFDTAFFSFFAARICRKKFIFDIFDFLYDKPKGSFQKLIKSMQYKLINKADATIICTEERVRQIEGSRPRRLEVIHNTPIADQMDVSTIHHDTDAVKVCYVGIFQDYRLLLEIGDYFSKHHDIEWHVGGFGKYEDTIEGLSRKNDNIKYYGRLSYDKTLALEKSCDILLAIYDPILSNHVYAAPNKFYESLMLGKPVIMVKGTGMSTIVREENVGVLIDYSEEGFGNGINELLERRSEWSSMSSRMKELYAEKYNWSTMERRLVALYDSLDDGLSNEENIDSK